MGLSPYKERLRIRVSGLLVREEALLMVKVRSPITDKYIWIPPGGGLEYGENMEECLVREFREETGLNITVSSLRHVNELLEPPFHAVEFYFNVQQSDSGSLELGKDPEQAPDKQILEDLQYISFKDFTRLPVVPEYLKKQFVDDYNTGKNAIRYSPDKY